jgi:hypothetical protein
MPSVSALLRFALPGAAILVAAFAVYAVLGRMTVNEQAAERRALLARDAELTGRALAPGSPLGCLTGGAGDTLENACEKAVFADASSAAAALAFTAARLVLLQDAAALAQRGADGVTSALTGVRRAIELDRFGLAAYVLADRDGCTPERCAAFALVKETGALKANLKARVFDQYVARHAPRWERPVPAADAVPQAAAPPQQVTPPVASAAPPPAGRPVDSKWQFPSAASIPAVSIMTAEPARPKEGSKDAAEAQAAQPMGEGETVPVPPKRPQAQLPSVAPSATQAR